MQKLDTLKNIVTKLKNMNYEKVYYFLSVLVLVIALNIIQFKYFIIGNVFFSFVKLLITVGFVISFQMFVSSLFKNKLYNKKD